jgi:hypothetical protein
MRLISALWLSRRSLLFVRMVCTVVAAFSFQREVATQSSSVYFVYDGTSLTRVTGNPRRSPATEWGAFYFPRGVSPTDPAKRWGLDLKKSPGDALKAVAANQKFEKKYERWCGCDWGRNTFSNAVAPVAMVKKAAAFNPKQAQLLSKAHAVWDKVQASLDTFDKAASLAGESSGGRASNGPAAEYMRAMHRAFDQFHSINSQITPYSNTTMRKLERLLNSFAESERLAASAADRALKSSSPKELVQGATVQSESTRSLLALFRRPKGCEEWRLVQTAIEKGANANARTASGSTILLTAQQQLDQLRAEYQQRVASLPPFELPPTDLAVRDCAHSIRLLTDAGATLSASEQAAYQLAETERRRDAKLREEQANRDREERLRNQARERADQLRRQEQERIDEQRRREEERLSAVARREYDRRLDQYLDLVEDRNRLIQDRDANRQAERQSSDDRQDREYYRRLADRAERELGDVRRREIDAVRELNRACRESHRADNVVNDCRFEVPAY